VAEITREAALEVHGRGPTLAKEFTSLTRTKVKSNTRDCRAAYFIGQRCRNRDAAASQWDDTIACSRGEFRLGDTLMKMQSEPDHRRSLLPLFGLAVIVLLVFVWTYAH
jgi:hypothetical protein